MANDTQIAIRLPSELAERLRSHADKLARETGLRVSLAAAARRLLELALEAELPPTRRARR